MSRAMGRKISLFILLLVLTVFSVSLRAQEPSERSWETLTQLQAEQTIQVVQMDLKSLKGTFLNVSEEAILLRVNENEVSVPRADVLRVSWLDVAKRKRNMLLGLGIGAGGGMLIGAAAASPFFDEGTGFKPGAIILAGIGAGAGIGLALGASSGFQTIYRSERKQDGTAP